MIYSEMATIQKRKSHGQTYWYIVESRRVKGKPRPVMLAYLGKADDLLRRLTGKDAFELKSFSHGDTAALLNIAVELGIIDSINKHVAPAKDKKPVRDGLTVGASLLLAAIGRACHPTSKRGWYEWCHSTSLEYCLRTSLKKLDSRHFWDQMEFIPVEKIALIEEEIVKKLLAIQQVKLDCLFFDTTNFFTFIDSANERCKLPRRGRNKQKRFDLRQIGLALLVSRKDQFPLFHRSYPGNINDTTVFKENFCAVAERIRHIAEDLEEITLVFDKGNNSKDNFKLLDNEKDIHYVAGLVPAHFMELITAANKAFAAVLSEKEKVPFYRIKQEIWGKERTCVVTISQQLKEGQIQGIHQHLDKKYKALEAYKQQLENPARRKKYTKDAVTARAGKICKGQFVNAILKFELIELAGGSPSFTYHLDDEAFAKLKNEVLGRKILVTDHHDWSNEEIGNAYKGSAKVEYAFKNFKNPFHCAARPQHHWTDQKIAVHMFLCELGYLLASAAYAKAKKQANYERDMDHFLSDLASIRLAGMIEKKQPGKKGCFKVTYRLEQIPPELKDTLTALDVHDQNLRSNLKLGVYTDAIG